MDIFSEMTSTQIKPPPAPNHLLQSQIFRRTGANAFVQLIPEKLIFNGFQPNEKTTKTIKILNISKSRQKFHILPPETPFFSIDYKKFDGPHVPGVALKVEVSFKPDSWRVYQDSIKLHCPDPEENLILPIHAYPSVDVSNFPKKIDFLNVKLGSKASRSFTIWSRSHIDFEYNIGLKNNDDFSVKPSGNGIIPAGNSAEFTVTYFPKEYCTKSSELSLIITSGPLIKPLKSLITGNCKLRALKELPSRHEREAATKIVNNPKPKSKKHIRQKSLEVLPKIENTLSHLSSQHGTNKILVRYPFWYLFLNNFSSVKLCKIYLIDQNTK